MKKVVCIDDAGAEGITVNKIYEAFEEGFTLRIVNDFGEKAWYFVERFKEAPVKIKLLLKDEFELEVNNRKYFVNHYNLWTGIFIEYNKMEEHSIRWGTDYNTTLADIQPILDFLNIEIVEPAPLYKIDVEGEYTAEQVAELEKLGIKIKRRRA